MLLAVWVSLLLLRVGTSIDSVAQRMIDRYVRKRPPLAGRSLPCLVALCSGFFFFLERSSPFDVCFVRIWRMWRGRFVSGKRALLLGSAAGSTRQMKLALT